MSGKRKSKGKAGAAAPPAGQAPRANTRRQPALSAAECGCLTLILLAALSVRVAYPERIAIEHFDEGVYASNLWFEADHDYRYPQRHFYAPPLLPWLLEWSQVFLGPTAWAIVVVNGTAGLATVLLLWWVGRHWFGPECGLAAAWILALNDFHILYSRTALTDVLLGCGILLAVYLFWEACRRESWKWTAAAGLAAGLTWATKYNGWLPVAIAVFSLAACSSWEHGRRFWQDRRWPVAAVMAVVMLCVWSPVWWDLQDRGGYAAVAANHRQYVVGWEGWLPGLLQQCQNLHFLEGGFSGVGISLAIGTIGWLTAVRLPAGNQPAQSRSPTAVGFAASDDHARQDVRRRWRFSFAAAVMVAVVSVVAFWMGTGMLLIATALTGMVCSAAVVGVRFEAAARLAACLLFVWFCSLLLATPFYVPYPRLLMPWLIGCCLASAVGLAAIFRGLAGRPLISSSDDAASNDGGERATANRAVARPWLGALPPSAILLGAVTVVGLLIGSWEKFSSQGVPGWQSRTGIALAATEIEQALEQQLEREPHEANHRIVYVYAEPALFYHLWVAGIAAAPVATLDFAHPRTPRPPVPVFLAFGPHARQSVQFDEQWQRYHEQFEFLAEIGYRPSRQVLLNQHHPSALRAGQQAVETPIRVYRLR